MNMLVNMKDAPRRVRSEIHVLDAIGVWKSEYDRETLLADLVEARRERRDECMDWIKRVNPEVEIIIERGVKFLSLPYEFRIFSLGIKARPVMRNASKRFLIHLFEFLINCAFLGEKSRHPERMIFPTKYRVEIGHIAPRILKLLRLDLEVLPCCGCYYVGAAQSKYRKPFHTKRSECKKPTIVVRLGKFEQLRGLLLVWRKSCSDIPKDVVMIIAKYVLSYQLGDVLVLQDL